MDIFERATTSAQEAAAYKKMRNIHGSQEPQGGQEFLFLQTETKLQRLSESYKMFEP